MVLQEKTGFSHEITGSSLSNSETTVEFIST